MANKPKYPFELLLEYLNTYTTKHPNMKIKLSDLAKETNVPRHIWKDNKKIKEVIDNLNNTPIVANPINLNFTLPNASKLVESNYNNKSRLIKVVQDSFDVISDLYEKALIGSKVEEREKEFHDKINELEAQIRLKNEEIKRLNTQIDLLYLDSESPTKRRKQGLKDNLIELSPSNIKSISKDISDIKDEYDGLFD